MRSCITCGGNFSCPVYMGLEAVYSCEAVIGRLQIGMKEYEEKVYKLTGRHCPVYESTMEVKQ